MDWIRILFNRCAAVLRRKRLDEELDEELHTHIALAVEENLKRGPPRCGISAVILRCVCGAASCTARCSRCLHHDHLSALGALGHDVHNQGHPVSRVEDVPFLFRRHRYALPEDCPASPS